MSTKRQRDLTAALTAIEASIGERPIVSAIREERLSQNTSCRLTNAMVQWTFEYNGRQAFGWMSPGILMWFVNRMMGGSGDAIGRKLSGIEQSAVKPLLVRLSQAISGVTVDEVETIGLRHPPIQVRLRSAASLREYSVQVNSLQKSSTVSEQSPFFGRMVYLIPDVANAVAEGNHFESPNSPEGNDQSSEEDKQETATEAGTRQVAVLQAILGKVSFPQQEILGLEVGDIVVLSTPAYDPLDVYCNGTPVAKGKPGLVGSKFAVEISHRLKSEE